MVGLNRTPMSAIETGKLKPWKKITKKLEKLLGLSSEELFSELSERGESK